MVVWALLSRCFVYLLVTEHMSVSVTVAHFALLTDHFSFPLACKRVKCNGGVSLSLFHILINIAQFLQTEQGYVNYRFLFIHYSCNSAL